MDYISIGLSIRKCIANMRETNFIGIFLTVWIEFRCLEFFFVSGWRGKRWKTLHSSIALKWERTMQKAVANRALDKDRKRTLIQNTVTFIESHDTWCANRSLLPSCYFHTFEWKLIYLIYPMAVILHISHIHWTRSRARVKPCKWHVTPYANIIFWLSFIQYLPYGR